MLDPRLVVANRKEEKKIKPTRNRNKLREKKEHVDIWIENRNKTGNELELKEHNK